MNIVIHSYVWWCIVISYLIFDLIWLVELPQTIITFLSLFFILTITVPIIFVLSKLFFKQLNDISCVVKIPFQRRFPIFQSISKKKLHKYFGDKKYDKRKKCRSLLENFSEESLNNIFNSLPRGKYKIITYERIKNVLAYSDNHALKVTSINYICDTSFAKTQNNLFKQQCKNCTAKRCVIQKQGNRIKKMYYIKFEKIA